MLFRDKEGNTRDISQAIQLTPDVANNGDCNIRLASSTDASTSLPTELRVGFEMGVRLSGGVPKGFEGKLGQSAWKGQFVCTSSLPFAAIVEGEKPLPDNVKSFLDITPLVTKTADGRTDTVDQARLSAKDIFKEVITALRISFPAFIIADFISLQIMLHALSDKAKELYFDKLQDLGSGTINGGQALPTKLQDASFPFAFTKILSDDKSVLYICAMHLLCRALKNSGWLEQKYKDGIKDDCDVFFANLTSKTVDNSTLPQWIKAGPEVVAILRSQFIDAMNRCYFAAYICVNQSIVNYFQDPTSIYDQVKATILSANYKAYWIPKTIGAAQDTSAQMLRIRLGILHDKLVMLLAVAQRYQGSWQGQTPDVDNIINQLAQAAKETGLVDLTNVNLQPEVSSSSLNFLPSPMLTPVISDHHLYARQHLQR